MNLKSGLYKNGYEIYLCICGSHVQSRNIKNHYDTAKHKRFLLCNRGLLDEYALLTREEICYRISQKDNSKYLRKIYLDKPIIIKFD